MLWFGDERGYNATSSAYLREILCCGLVMKEDITQLPCLQSSTPLGCGLVMKEDITQLESELEEPRVGCGLVMKEDITQQVCQCNPNPEVVVW